LNVPGAIVRGNHDNDNDGVLNPDDNCANGPSGDPDQTDSDANGFGDLCDEDGAGNNIPRGTRLLFSTSNTAQLSGSMTFGAADLVEWDPDSNTATLRFSEESLAANEKIDAAHVLPNGNIVLSTAAVAVLGQNEFSFERGDLVEFDPVSEMASLFFSCENFAGIEDIDAVHVLSDGHIVLSTKTAARLGLNGLSFEDGDLVEYDPDTDTASLFFRQDAFQGTPNVDAVHVFEEKGTILLSTASTASLGGLVDFSRGDVVLYDPAIDAALPFFGVSNFASVENVNAVHVVPLSEPGEALMLVAGIALLAMVGRRRMAR